MQAKGRDALTGLPAVRPVTAWEIGEALSEPLMEMLSGVQRVLETTPPELAGDVMEHGMVLTGRRREAGPVLPGLSRPIPAFPAGWPNSRTNVWPSARARR